MKTQTRSAAAPAADACPEGQLLQRHLQGEEGAFAVLMRAYATPIYGYLTRCGVATTDRDDLFQEVFTRIHRAAHTYHSESPLRPWLFAIVANAVRNHFGRRRELRLVAPDVSDDAPSAAPGPDRLFEARETARWIEAEIERLPLPQREVVVLCCIEQWEQKEVAEVLSIPVNTVKTHLRRARLTLARGLARRKRALDREVSR